MAQTTRTMLRGRRPIPEYRSTSLVGVAAMATLILVATTRENAQAAAPNRKCFDTSWSILRFCLACRGGGRSLRGVCYPRPEREPRNPAAVKLDRYTVKSQEALERAQRIARERGQPELLPEHLLAALL